MMRRRAGKDGTLTVPVPDALRDKELEVLVVLQPVGAAAEGETATDGHGWPLGFLDDTYGSLADDPLERLPQGTLESRDIVR